MVMDIRMLLLLLLVVSVQNCNTKKILILPLQFPSVVSLHQSLGNALVDHGHEVTMILPPSLPKLDKFSQGRIKILTHQIYGEDFYNTTITGYDWADEHIGKPFTYVYRYMVDGIASFCKDIIIDKKLMSTLKEMNFDLAIVDSNIGVRLFYLVPYLLGIPYVSLNCERDTWALRNTDPPSHVPFVLGTTYTNQMNFWERLDNTYKMVEWAFFPNVWYNEDTMVQSLVPGAPVTLDDLYRKSLLFFMDVDMTIDYPRATLPNEIILGGLTIKKSDPLPADLETIMQNSNDGVILMSFGSSFPDKNVEVFFEVFRDLPQTVIWRYYGEIPNKVPDNVKLLQWLPQFDILAHKNTKLFITHCGNMGQHESVYHGVPMVGFPFAGDQMYNARRIEHHGFGIALNIQTVTTSMLYDTLMEVLNNPSYKEKTQKASKIMQDQATFPAEKGAMWVEHVMKYGGSHLRPHSQDMPGYQILMLDILAFLLIVAFVMFALLLLIIKCILQSWKKPKAKSE